MGIDTLDQPVVTSNPGDGCGGDEVVAVVAVAVVVVGTCFVVVLFIAIRYIYIYIYRLSSDVYLISYFYMA